MAITRTLAKAHGDGAGAAQKAIEAIRNVGFAAADATTNVQKLIIADIGLDKATSLAKIAKDAAAVNTEGLDATQAFEKLMLAIETGQERGLRTMSLFPKMAEAEEVARLQAQLHGKTLSDLEVKQVRYNAIVEASKTIHGSAAEAAGTYDGQMAKLSRDMKDLREDVGKAFQGELIAVVGLLKGVVSFFSDHTDAIEKFGKGTLVLVGIIATITAATKAWALAQGALNLAMAINPAFLLAGGIIGAGAIIYKEYSDMKEGMDARYKQMETDALRKDVGSGKVKIDDLRKRGMTDDQIRELISGRKLEPGESFEGFDTGVKLKIGGTGKPDPEALKLAIEVQKRQRENEQYFKDQSIAATGAGKTGYAKDVAEMNAEIARRTTFTDDKGTHQVALTKSAWDVDHRHDAEEVPGVQGPLRAGEQEDPRGLPQGRGREAPEGNGVRGQAIPGASQERRGYRGEEPRPSPDGVRLRGAAGGLRAGRASPAGGGRWTRRLSSRRSRSSSRKPPSRSTIWRRSTR